MVALCPQSSLSSTPLVLGWAVPARPVPPGRFWQELKDSSLIFSTEPFFSLSGSFCSRNSEARHQEGPGYWDLRPAVCRELTTQVTSSVRGPGLLPLIIVPNRLTSDVASLINTYPLLINRHSVSFPRKHCVFLFIKCQAERVASRRTTRTAHLYAAVRFCQAPL